MRYWLGLMSKRLFVILYMVVSLASSYSYYMQCLGCKRVNMLGFLPSCTRFQFGAGVCAVVVVTGEVNCHHFIVHLRSLQRFAETISQGYCSAVQRPLACKDGTT